MNSPSSGAGSRRRVAMVSLGCPKNQVDSELILGRLAAEGAEFVDDPETADVLVVNTCSFIDKARAESVETLLEAAEWKSRRKGRRIIAAGCLVQRSGDELAANLPEIDGFVGLDQIRQVGELTRAPAPALPPLPTAGSAAEELYAASEPRLRLSPPWSAYVKIAEGCDQSCAFCAIPSFRGKMRSRPLDDLLAEIGHLAADGVQEINLIAQDSTSYGRDLGLRDGLAQLIEAIEAQEHTPPWVRLHYLYPGRLSSRLMEALSGAHRLVRYVDLPLQHADREVLRRMQRPGDADSYLRQVEALRRALPGAGLRSAFIVGFPGETDAAFRTLLDFVEQLAPDSAGVFTYSHEQGTAAHGLEDDVPQPLKDERREALEELCASISHQRGEERRGQRLTVLCEGAAEDRPEHGAARWEGQAPEVDGRVLIEGAAELPAGTFARVTITGAGPWELQARLLGPADSDEA
ncbi:MAG TPA: 30S ribosomal protein S12 methylthiotransferase RimO [Acidobacteria bacterium]|nr:30S ribosomal protein S12 methylthiotransferase RimO [Acidobacteriota bacterium]